MEMLGRGRKEELEKEFGRGVSEKCLGEVRGTLPEQEGHRGYRGSVKVGKARGEY